MEALSQGLRERLNITAAIAAEIVEPPHRTEEGTTRRARRRRRQAHLPHCRCAQAAAAHRQSDDDHGSDPRDLRFGRRLISFIHERCRALTRGRRDDDSPRLLRPKSRIRPAISIICPHSDDRATGQTLHRFLTAWLALLGLCPDGVISFDPIPIWYTATG